MTDGWSFLTNHAHVLVCIAANPDIRTRDIASRVGITERSAQRIVAELEETGYISHVKRGRRNHYEVDPGLSLRHELEGHLSVGAILDVIVPSVSDD